MLLDMLDRYFALAAQPALRGYQIDIVRGTEEAFQKGARSVLVESMTGSGKTTIGARLVWDPVASGQRVLWLAHREELITQARDRLESFGGSGGVIKAGHPEDLQRGLQVLRQDHRGVPPGGGRRTHGHALEA